MTSIADEQIKPGAPVPDTQILPTGLNATGKEQPELRAVRLAHAAAIKSEVDGTSAIEAFESINSQGPEVQGKPTRYSEAVKLHDSDTVDARQLIFEQALEVSDNTTAMEVLVESESKDAELSAREDFPIQQFVRSIADPDMPDSERQTLATNLYLSDKIAELSADISGMEIAKDVLLEVLISPKATWDNMQATGTFNPVKGEATYRKLAIWFQGLDNDQKIEMFPALQEYIIDAMPRHRAVTFLQGLVDPAYTDDGAFDVGTMGAIDAALIGAGIFAGGLRLRKLFNPLSAAARAGDTERAAETNVALMQGLDNDLGDLMGVDRHTANSNALPFLGKGVNDSVESGLSAAVHERIYAFRDLLKQNFGDLADAKTFVREGFLDDQDKTKAVNRLTDEYNTYVAAQYQSRDKIVNLTGKKETSEGVVFEFEVVSPDGSVVKDRYVGQFTHDEIGFWQRLPGKGSFLSEKAQSHKTDFMSTVDAAVRLDNTAAAVGAQLRRVVREASKPIKGFGGKPRKQRVDEVDQVLLSGDDLESEFTPQQLKAGVNGVQLDEAQIEYYYNMRGIMNGLGVLRNLEAARSMRARGVKEIVVGNNRWFGTVIEEAIGARNRIKSLKSVYKFDGKGRRVEVNALKMEQEYQDGYRLVRLEQDEVIDGNRYQHVLIKSEQAGPLPDVVLDLKKGYIPRINAKATYFVQAFTPSSLDGVEGTVRKAIRSFDNQKEAEAFAGKFDLIKTTEKGLTDDTFIRVVPDGELEAFRAGDTGATQVGGLIYSPRARKPIPHNDGDAATVPRTSALESIELYLENTKSFMTRNEWRMGLRRKWENTAKFQLGHHVPFEEGQNIASPELNAAWTKINEFSGFMDKSERAWEQTVKSVYEWSIEKAGRNRISDFILTQRHKDPLARLRAATFHTLLGMYNPIQLWVQAQGMAVAFSMNLNHPARMVKAFRQQHALALTQHVNFDDSAKINAGIAKASGFDSVEEMQEMRTLWQKSGLYDSTLSNADVEAAARGFPTSGGAVKKFFDSGLMFFRAGELFNRRFAFLTAIDELGGPAKVAASSQLLKKALTRTNNLILNLGKANRAAWQKGFLSIPTQFLQIQAKTLESIAGLNGAFTKGEAGKLLFGQLALYGAAGTFGGNWALNQMANLMGKDRIDVNNMDEGTLRAFTGGFTDWFLFQMGANVIGSDRGALLNGMDQTVLSLFTEESSAFEWFAGPSAVGPARIWAKLHEISPYFASPQDINGQVSFDSTDVTDTMNFIARGMGALAVSPFATGRQIDKYLLMRDLGQIRDKNGNLVAAPRGGFNWQTEWASLIGFKPELLQKKFDLSEINEEVRTYVQFRSNMLVMGWDDYLMDYQRAREDGRNLSEEDIARHRKRRSVLINSISDPGVRREVLKSFRHRLRNRKSGDSQLDRQMSKYLDNLILDVAGEFTSSDTRLIQTRDK